ncbi:MULTISPECIES: hypothetical protein [Campylobacter]|uniref:hypothetical protein n=1 Tax=Campylobacter TaxID=194 RepID=UPI000CE356B7|nr:hypothetical protein [Campylobacter hyointestinalis]PPB51190.1 hypothetical protein CDQ68_08515 [Campylobacter hyointestinalis subsp. hyointestinalis]PPB65611.1 hypothetical protein CDQ75_08910 [Campylobacter hyointestinalis subsp. hyointestinalis]PPB68055.1 hypothetical protein CDQ77_08535 [Campylobacter hyointestinalis subsp. hyointestinalis]
MKNLKNFNLSTSTQPTKSFEELDKEASRTAELEAKLAKYKKLGRPKSENPPTKQMTIYFSDNEMNFVEEQAKKEGVTKNQIIRQLVQDRIKQQ